jgi:hypothetical protein
MDGIVVLEPYATMIIEGQKSLELRSRRPPASKIGKRIYLLSSGEVLGIVRITSFSGPLSEEQIRARFFEHRVPEPKPGYYAWRLEVVKRFARRRKYVHPRGARVWLRNVRLFARTGFSSSR